MGITKAIGKNTLGGGSKMNVDLRTYNRSTHNLSTAWRSTMGIGTLVPCLCEVGLPGDTWDINIQSKVLTTPTVGPLFGSFKMQIDFFTCPIRLYNAMLHNNMLNVGLDIKQVKLPKAKVVVDENNLPNKDNLHPQVHPSSILAYLGIRGFSGNISEFPLTKDEFNIVPEIAYYDIFKNYYANKQEEKWYTISSGNVEKPITFTLEFNRDGYIIGGYMIYEFIEYPEWESYDYNFTRNNGVSAETMKTKWDIENNEDYDGKGTIFRYKVSEGPLNWGSPTDAINPNKASLEEYKLTDIDEFRELLLSYGKKQFYLGVDNTQNPCQNYLYNLFLKDERGRFKASKKGYGLALKTHQSDIFNNWIQTEWLDGDNGINAITSIDTSSGSFSIDTLNLSQKVYDMLNRIAVSGGTYQDWVETVYSTNWTIHTETPVYEGGASSEIIFQEVVSTNTGSDEALGTLAGRGKDTDQKGGKLKIKVSEPCYIIGIASITPRVDYCQGNRWDCKLDTLDDLHKPALDGIGFQDLMAWKMAWWAKPDTAIGKQPAWIDYMTNFNRTFGGFAIENDSAFMCLNRFYYPEDDDYQNGALNTTTYIRPQDFNYTFADNDINAENFWVQIGMGIETRRVMSAKQIPNL